MNTKTRCMLLILDGFGWRKNIDYNAIALAKTPHLSALMDQYGFQLLQASGTAVGLPEGYPGNSEAGHLTLGAGRVIEQDITRVFNAIQHETFEKNIVLRDMLAYAQQYTKRIHIIGLMSDGGVHSHISYIEAIILACARVTSMQIFIHVITDGRDSAPESAAIYLQRLEQVCAQHSNCAIATIQGRFYAMDRDNNWERTKKSYDILIGKTDKNQPASWQKIIDESYARGITDEFIVPTLLDPNGAIQPNDVCFLLNVRPERIRQLLRMLIGDRTVPISYIAVPALYLTTLTQYLPTAPVHVIFEPLVIDNALKELLAAHNKTIFTIAETEKYAHVTYFFNGQKEQAVATETRTLIPSLHEKNYVKHPEMSAHKITAALVHSFAASPADFYLVNYANMDMVGHSGNLQATIQAVECVDAQIGILYQEWVVKCNGILCIVGDHGKAEEMFDYTTNQPKTAHTTNPVPFLAIAQTPLPSTNQMHSLADVAPYISLLYGIH